MTSVHVYAPPGHFHANVWTLDGELVEQVAFAVGTTKEQAIARAKTLSHGYDYWRFTMVAWIDDSYLGDATWVWEEGRPLR